MMSSDGRYHHRGCHVGSKRGHTKGKWCWTEEDVQSLEKQHGEQKTWKQIANSFKFYDAEGHCICYRHHSIACQAKMNALLLDAAGQATSKKLAALAKRPSPTKKLHDDNDDALGKRETADMTKEQADQDAKDDAEAEQAIKEAIIKLEPESD